MSPWPVTPPPRYLLHSCSITNQSSNAFIYIPNIKLLYSGLTFAVTLLWWWDVKIHGNENVFVFPIGFNRGSCTRMWCMTVSCNFDERTILTLATIMNHPSLSIHLAANLTFFFFLANHQGLFFIYPNPPHIHIYTSHLLSIYTLKSKSFVVVNFITE